MWMIGSYCIGTINTLNDLVVNVIFLWIFCESNPVNVGYNIVDVHRDKGILALSLLNNYSNANSLVRKNSD